MNSRTNCCQGQILPECVCVNTGILVHLARGVNADEVWFGYCICTVVNITGEKKILLRYCKFELESLHVKVCEKCLLSQLQIEGRWR